MKKFWLLIITIVFISINLFAQRTLPTIDHFDYSLGELRSVGTDWSRISGSINDLNVVTGNLTYTNYPMSATGNQIQISSSGADDDKLTFTSQSTAGTKIYASFLVNITNSTGLSTGNYFAALGNGTSGYITRLYIRIDTNPSGFNFGIARNSTTVVEWSSIRNFGQTYLVVLGYEIVEGTSNDIARIWIDPDLGGTEPNATLTDAGTSSDGTIDGFFIRQSSGTPNANIDALRVATSWAEAPLPVELTSFSAATIGSTVKLSWNTATEVNNYGFEVERKTKDEKSKTWEKIGFVNGNGNSNSPKDYSFVDDKVSAGKYSYRLKQIDNDGQFEYSKTIEVDMNGVKKFELSQNYPNPFNPTTTIKFNLPEAGIVKLTLYNILGQQIRTLVNEFKESGVHTINFDASELNSGMYIYKIESGSFVQTRKMTLLK